MTSPQARYAQRAKQLGPLVKVQLLPTDGEACAQWTALVARYGGSKPALLALLRNGAKHLDTNTKIT